MVSLALATFDFAAFARLGADLLDFADVPDFAGLAPDLFFSFWAGMGASRPAGFWAKALYEKTGMENMEETKMIENPRLRIADCGLRILGIVSGELL